MAAACRLIAARSGDAAFVEAKELVSHATAYREPRLGARLLKLTLHAPLLSLDVPRASSAFASCQSPPCTEKMGVYGP